MRLLFTKRGYSPIGGSESLAYQFATRLVVRGHDVRVVCAWPTEKEEVAYRGATFAPVVHDDHRVFMDKGVEVVHVKPRGGIFGMGETPRQRVELAFELAELEPCEIPLNFLNPRPGTPLEGRPLVPALDAIRTIALFRLLFPSTVLRYAGGRELTLRELQPMGLFAGVNALIVGNYLTTLGRSPEADLQMLEDLGMPVRRRV